MKRSIFLLLVLLVSSNLVFCQVKKDSLADKHIYPPNLYDGFTPKESWEIHKEAYIKQLTAKGLTEKEFKKSLKAYEKQKEEFLAKVTEQQRTAEAERKKADEQRAKDAIERAKADELRKQAEIQMKKADELRKLADIERAKADEQRAKDAIERAKADELRKQAAIERAKADELRKLADIERAKADEQRKRSQEWRKNAEDILIKNIALSNQSSASQPVTFNLTSKTTLYIGIRANIVSGSTLIEIYNPKGIKEGELSLKFNSKSSSDENGLKYTSGALDKTITNAEVGKWQIKISSLKAEGNVAMSVAKYVKPTVDE
jgi:hypothetical protein